MPKVIFVHPDGKTTVLTAEPRASVMETAVAGGLDGIVAECGGNLMCATCHVYVDPEWAERLPAPAPVEEEMLTQTTCERLANSRLSCQIVLDDELNGLVVHLPEAQV